MELKKGYSAFFLAAYALLLCILLVCVVLLLVDPKKSLQIYPHPGVALHLFSDSVEPNGKSKVNWVERDNGAFVCDIAYGVPFPYCGVVVKFKQPASPNYELPDYFEYADAKAIDLSEYDGVEIAIDYEGASNLLNFYLRSAQVLPRNSSDYERVPHVHVTFDPRQPKPFVGFSEMRVARWWIDRFNPSSEKLTPDFSGVFEFGVDLPALPAEEIHQFRLKKIAATKSYVSRSRLWTGIFSFASLAFALLCVQIVLNISSRRYRKEAQILRTTMLLDPVTKCLNRMGLETAVSGLFPVASGSNIFVMVMDLDHFKRVNDTFGHAVGDEVLRQTSLAIAQELRSDDVFGRWGGEEFVLISKIAPEHLTSLIQRLMRSLENVKIDGATEAYRVTMSIGVTEAQLGEPFDQVFKRADAAMYQVKLAGRSNWKLS